MSQIQKVLIANRGEIAVRIIRACRELKLKTVAVYSNVDHDSLHVMLADETVCIGDHTLSNSYLNQKAILQAAINTGAHAIHPGYGFLSENADFVRACEKIGLIFIGPTANLIDIMGDKQTARETMSKAGLPTVPGSVGLVDNVNQAKKISKKIGYPVIIKATAGGGGKGMRIAFSEDDLVEAFEQARSESANAFGNDNVYIEKFVVNPRHIEVQIIGDKHGNIAHVFERECSVQRNNQKMIEEAPVQNLSAKARKHLYVVALKAAKAINYQSLGTIEFIMDDAENFYFIEMNTRVQVEHPISEVISGIDLIKEQISIADNEKLSFKQADIKPEGHAIELRINAEDPYNDFRPMAGTIEAVHFPGGNGVRIDSFIYQGYAIKPFYDSMIAKIIVLANDRDQAMAKAIACLEELDIVGIKTNVDFQLEVLLSDEFVNNTYTTALVNDLLKGD